VDRYYVVVMLSHLARDSGLCQPKEVKLMSKRSDKYIQFGDNDNVLSG
jgi:hypothetical protein